MDLIVLGIFFLTIFFSMRRGFIICSTKFIKGIVSIVLSAVFCSRLADLVIEKTELGSTVHEKIAGQLLSKWQESGIFSSAPGFLRNSINNIADAYTDRVSVYFTRILFIILSFVVILIALRSLIAIFASLAKRNRNRGGFPGFMDKALGTMLGAVLGIIYVFVFLALLFPAAGLIFPEKADLIMGWFDGSAFARDLYDNNLLLVLLQGRLMP